MRHESHLIRPGTLAEQITAWCDARRIDIGAMSTDSPTDIDLDELVTVWDQLDTIQRELGVWVRDLAVELGGRLIDQADGYTHPVVGHLEASKPATRTHWDGMAVLSGLSQPVVDGNGERIHAVPTALLEHVLPGVTGVSSKWKVSELPERLRKHRSVEYGPPLPRRTS